MNIAGHKTEAVYRRDTIVREIDRSRVSRNSLDGIPLNEFIVKGQI